MELSELENKQWLVVDDSSTMRKIITNHIEEQFPATIKIHESWNGHEALEMVEANPDISLVMTDWNMPVMTGFDFACKALEKYPNLDIIMITTEGEKLSILEAIRKGVKAYLVKPFSGEEFYKTIAKLYGLPLPD